MGWRFRKSVALGHGMKLNLGKSGGSFSFGVRGLRFTTGTSGSHVSASIPGTGVSYTTGIGGHHSHSASRGGGSLLGPTFSLALLLLMGAGLLWVLYGADAARGSSTDTRGENAFTSRHVDRY